MYVSITLGNTDKISEIPALLSEHTTPDIQQTLTCEAKNSKNKFTSFVLSSICSIDWIYQRKKRKKKPKNALCNTRKMCAFSFEVRLVICSFVCHCPPPTTVVKINAFTSMCRPSILFRVAFRGLCCALMHRFPLCTNATKAKSPPDIWWVQINQNFRSIRIANRNLCECAKHFINSISLLKYKSFSHVTRLVTGNRWRPKRNEINFIYFPFAECKDARALHFFFVPLVLVLLRLVCPCVRNTFSVYGLLIFTQLAHKWQQRTYSMQQQQHS